MKIVWIITNPIWGVLAIPDYPSMWLPDRSKAHRFASKREALKESARWAAGLATVEKHEIARLPGMTLARRHRKDTLTVIDINQRARELYRQLQAQRAVLKTYDDALSFVRIRQMEATDTVKPVADKLWELACQPKKD